MGFEPPQSTKPASVTPQRPQQSPTLTTYVQKYLPPQDPAAIYQLVGFMEYARALMYLDSLVLSCNDEERKAIDTLIRQQEELAVDVNLSRTVEQRSSLSEPLRVGDDFKRRGLAWVTGLARAEIGAMLAGFADRDDTFARLAVQYDLDAYIQLLVDGIRVHYWSLTKDPILKAVLAGKANANRTLAYFRRLLVAQAMLKAVVQLAPQLTPKQQAELNVWQVNLDKTQSLLAERIAVFHQP